jgi:hypothetical protein
MERLEQILAILSLVMGLCLMWDGYTDLSQTSYLSGFALRSTTVSGGSPIQATISFSDVTPAEGAVVKLTSTRPFGCVRLGRAGAACQQGVEFPDCYS